MCVLNYVYSDFIIVFILYRFTKNKRFFLEKKGYCVLCTTPEPDVPQRESAGHAIPGRGLQKAVGPDPCAVMLLIPK